MFYGIVITAYGLYFLLIKNLKFKSMPEINSTWFNVFYCNDIHIFFVSVA